MTENKTALSGRDHWASWGLAGVLLLLLPLISAAFTDAGGRAIGTIDIGTPGLPTQGHMAGTVPTDSRLD